MPINNNVEEKECYGKQNLYDVEYCIKNGCCHIMRDECYIQTVENIDDENVETFIRG